MKKAFVIVCIITILLSCKNSNNEINQTKGVYEAILSKGTIRVGYIPYPPAVIKDPNTKQLSGIFYDVLMQAGKNLDLKVEFVEEVAWGTMIEAVKTNRIDLVCTAVYAKSQRGKFVDFTLPLYYSPLKTFTYSNNKTFDNDISKINNPNIKIATIDGEAVSILAKTDFPNAQKVSLTQSSDVSQMLEEVATKKADVTFVEPVFANMYIKNNPNKIREVSGIDPVRVYPVVMMIAKDEGKFKSTVNIALQELHDNGFVEKMIKKYEPLPNSFYRVQNSYKIK